MNKHFFTGALLLGAAAIAWVASGFFANHALALAMTILIGAAYGFGAFELYRFRQATASLSDALAHIPEPLQNLDDWLAEVHVSLQNPVRLRIEGERIGLPGPALTPYLVGLLVMLGMLGTFLGMVVTLNGAVFALEGTSDLETIRSAFAAPIRGLGLAFGTSVAGVASSAMLGLMSALSRRERLQAAQLLDGRIATALRGFSLTHQRQESLKALQLQSSLLPAVVDQLQAMTVQMQAMGQQLNQRLLSNQEGFHSEIKSVYTDLARSVDASLRSSLSHSAQAAADSMQPVLQAALSGMAAQAGTLHERMVERTQQQLAALSTTLAANAGELLTGMRNAYSSTQAEQSSQDSLRLQAWRDSLEDMATGLRQTWQESSAQTLTQQQRICSTLTETAQQMTESTQTSSEKSLHQATQLLASSEELVRTRIATEADWSAQHAARMEQITAVLQTELGALRSEESLRGDAAVERLGALQTALTSHLTTLGQALEDPITRLIETASEAPRAAAEVIGRLREEVSHSVARDNALLEERSRIMETLNALLGSINQASTEQRAVIDSLVESSALALQHASSQFGARVDTETHKLSELAASVSGSAVEVSTLSDSFGFAVRSFSDANEKLISNLQRIEAALDKSMARSDDQLAYYVAQAREILDLSILSQKGIFEELRQAQPATQEAT